MCPHGTGVLPHTITSSFPKPILWLPRCACPPLASSLPLSLLPFHRCPAPAPSQGGSSGSPLARFEQGTGRQQQVSIITSMIACCGDSARDREAGCSRRTAESFWPSPELSGARSTRSSTRWTSQTSTRSAGSLQRCRASQRSRKRESELDFKQTLHRQGRDADANKVGSSAEHLPTHRGTAEPCKRRALASKASLRGDG